MTLHIYYDKHNSLEAKFDVLAIREDSSWTLEFNQCGDGAGTYEYVFHLESSDSSLFMSLEGMPKLSSYSIQRGIAFVTASIRSQIASQEYICFHELVSFFWGHDPEPE